MPKYVLPEPKKSEGAELMDVGAPYSRSVYLPADAAIIEALEIGDEVEVTLIGKVTGLEARQREGESEDFNEFNLELKSVEAYSEKENDFEKMAREDPK